MLRSETWQGHQWWMPAKDTTSIAHRYNTVWHIDEALKHTEGRRAVIQAGGNIGQWPHYLASRFERVYTFEPDPVNFACLAMNTLGLDNVYKFQAALGMRTWHVPFTHDEKNCEGSHIGGDGAEVPMLMIDQCVNDNVDLILLDTEGYELHALEGAKQTLEDLHPTVLLEKRHQERYDVSWQEIDDFLRALGYTKVSEASHDVIYKVPTK